MIDGIDPGMILCLAMVEATFFGLLVGMLWAKAGQYLAERGSSAKVGQGHDDTKSQTPDPR